MFSATTSSHCAPVVGHMPMPEGFLDLARNGQEFVGVER